MPGRRGVMNDQERVMKSTSRVLIAVTVAAISGSVACTTATTATRHMRPDPPDEKLVRSVEASAVAHQPWRPLHKGGSDLSTGVYIRDDDDLIVNTPFPIVLRRTYNSGDGFSRQFGQDATHAGEWWLFGDGNPRIPWADLILPTGGRIHFVRISPGNTQVGAVLRHDSTPTEFNGALLSWTGSLWEMRFRDGSTASFLDCQTDKEVCSLVERRDPDGHRIEYVRDRSGRLLRMESEGQSIAFDYDDHKRIIRAYDTSQREVSYTYDDRGRLVRVTGTERIVREYDYDERSLLVGVREPGRILQNWFDEAGRWVKQVVKRSEHDEDPYVATARYVVKGDLIIESDFDAGDGLLVERYNTDHYVISETLDADGPAPIVFAYNLDPVTNVSKGGTMSCVGPSGPVTRTAQIAAKDNGAKEALMHESCLRR
jgi:YD repeat-containing protein